jgi:hypothetical protein
LDDNGVPSLAAGGGQAAHLRRLEELSSPFQDQDAEMWRRRDEIERKYRKLGMKSVSWAHILRNITRLRPRHIKALLKARFG